MKDLLRVADLTADDLELLLRRAAAGKAMPSFERDLLAGRIVVHYFAKPSTRTRLSFEAAVASLGGVPVVVGPNELQLGRGETIEDTAEVMSRYAAAITIRTYDQADVERLAAAATVPVINALTDAHHPCQALADLLTIRERFGPRPVKVAYIGDGNNVAHSLMEGCAMMGHHLVVATPPGHEPAVEVSAPSMEVAEQSGGSVLVTHDPWLAAIDADVVYTDVWLSMGDPDAERDARRRAFRPYTVDEKVMALAAPGAIFLHCLPAHRGEEVAAAVIDGRWSAVFDQAENRMHMAKALLVALLKRQLSTRGVKLVDR